MLKNIFENLYDKKLKKIVHYGVFTSKPVLKDLRLRLTNFNPFFVSVACHAFGSLRARTVGVACHEMSKNNCTFISEVNATHTVVLYSIVFLYGRSPLQISYYKFMAKIIFLKVERKEKKILHWGSYAQIRCESVKRNLRLGFKNFNPFLVGFT